MVTDYHELAERLLHHFDDCPPSLGDKSSTRPLLIEAAKAIKELTGTTAAKAGSDCAGGQEGQS